MRNQGDATHDLTTAAAAQRLVLLRYMRPAARILAHRHG
jgi:hypothetical protein